MSDSFYKPLTPLLRSEINNGFNEQIAELQTCEKNVFVNLQLESLRISKNLINGLPDGYPIPFRKE